MQPETHQTPVIGAEQLPMPPVTGGEQIPSLPPLETGIEKGADRREQIAEASAVVSDLTGGVPQAVPVAPVTNNDPVAADPSTGVQGPVTAADEDVIEKEWVDKAKEIIQATKDDPYERTNQVSQLQRDYLKKRYGKDVGVG